MERDSGHGEGKHPPPVSRLDQCLNTAHEQ